MRSRAPSSRRHSRAPGSHRRSAPSARTHSRPGRRKHGPPRRVTVGSLSYGISCRTDQFTAGIVASKAELRSLREAFVASMSPVEKFSTQIDHLSDLAAKFPDKAGPLQTQIAELRTKMAAAQNAGGMLSQVMGRMGVVVDPVSAAFQAFNIATGLARTGMEALKSLVSSVAEEMVNLEATSRKAGMLGINESSLVGFRGAAEDLAGVAAEAFDGAFSKFAVNIGQAAMSGKGPAAEALERIGLNANQLSGMAPDKQLLAVADALSTVENVNERLALSKGILGKGGEELAPMLAAGGDAIRAMAAEQVALSQTEFIDHESVKDALALVRDLSDAFTGIISLLASSLAPLVAETSKDMLSGFKDATDEGENLRTTIDGIALSLADVVDRIEAASSLFGKFASVGTGLGGGVLKQLPGGAFASGVGAAAGPLLNSLDYDHDKRDAVLKARELQEQRAMERTAERAAQQADQIAQRKTDAELKALAQQAKAAEDFRVMEIQAELDLAAAVERADKKRLADRVKIGEDLQKQMDGVNREIAAKGEQLAEQFKNPATRLMDDIAELEDAHRLGSITDDIFQRGLMDLKGKAGDMAFLDPGARTVGAVRGGSIEALRAEFSGKSNTEKQLEEQKKIEENTNDAAEALNRIEQLLANGNGGIREIA